MQNILSAGAYYEITLLENLSNLFPKIISQKHNLSRSKRLTYALHLS